MTDIMKRLEEAQVLYERAGINGANGAGLMNDAQERIDTLTRERDEWALMVGKLAATIPMKDTIGATGTLGNMLDFFNGREARIDELEAANDAAGELEVYLTYAMDGPWLSYHPDAAKEAISTYRAALKEGK